MSSPLVKGARVVSVGFGPGIVIGAIGNRVMVQFDRYPLQLQVDASTITPVGSALGQGPVSPPHARAPAAPTLTPQPLPAGLAARRAVDALRFGVVPAGAVGEVTLQFSAWRRWVESRLPGADGDKPTMTEISGAFGSGKSHAMSVVRHVAREAGYLTANVEVDGVYVTFANPQQLLAQLLRSTKSNTHESATLLLDLCLEVVANRQGLWDRKLRQFPALLANLDVLSETRGAGLVDQYTEDLNGLVAGDDAKTPTQLFQELSRSLRFAGGDLTSKPCRLVPYKVAERARGFADALMGFAAVAQLAGHKGLVVTFDEFEVQPAFLSRAEWQRLVEVLSELARRLRDASDAGPLAVFIATVEGSEAVGDQVVAQLREVVGGERRELGIPTRADLEELGRLVAALYSRAYGLGESNVLAVAKAVSLPDSTAVAALGGKMRAQVRCLIAALDSHLGPPEH